MHSFTSETVHLMLCYTDLHSLEKVLNCEGGAVGLNTPYTCILLT